MRAKQRTWWRWLRLTVRVLALAALALVATSHQAKALKLLAPTRFGMESLGGQIYVNREMSSAQREEVLRIVADARRKIGDFYGGVATSPMMVFCSTEERFRAFGGTQQRGVSFGPYALLLAPRGLTVPILAHEWSHAELFRRVGGYWHWRKVPEWFNEGLAVVVSDEPSHSEAVYQQARQEGVPIPALSDLVSSRQWNAAAKSYYDPAKNPHHLHVVYATAGHEVRSWLQAAQPAGLRAFLEAMRSGAAFADARAGARKASGGGGTDFPRKRSGPC